ncbi:MAG: hypothetical protein H0V91_01350 [Flavisolibacter sp.]|nr:hypothetical protein [Flavisolibacter sp.]
MLISVNTFRCHADDPDSYRDSIFLFFSSLLLIEVVKDPDLRQDDNNQAFTFF